MQDLNQFTLQVLTNEQESILRMDQDGESLIDKKQDISG